MPTDHSTPTPWYREAFQEGYLELYGHRNLAEAAQAVKLLSGTLALDGSHTVLDLCCGPGRHLFFLRQYVGRAIGLDLSRILLRRAGEHLRLGFAGAPAASARAGLVPGLLVQGTMARLPFPGATFDRVLNLFTSFGYFEEEADNARVLAEVARVLRPGGMMAIDHINRATLLAGLRPETERALPDGGRVLERRTWQAATQRVEKTITRLTADGQRHSWRESVRVYQPEELEDLLRAHGLMPQQRLGDYEGGAWSPDAARLLIVARRV